jgi:pimeloyl-ACP methyl ester carboxylesterase
MADARHESGHAPVNGIEMYYELHGPSGGMPLVLLHGGGSTIDVTWSKILPLFAQTRCVIALEEQGHGRTSDRDAPVAFESSADDVAALLQHLDVAQANVFGFSNGAHVALHVAIRHPALVRKLVFASAMTKRDGAYPWFWEFMQKADVSNMPQPLKDAFLEVTPDAQKLRTMHDKDAARMQNFQDFPDDLLRAIKAQTLVIAGDREAIKPEHALELSRLIPDCRLLILPATHGDYLGEAIMTPQGSTYFEVTARLVEDFLDQA